MKTRIQHTAVVPSLVCYGHENHMTMNQRLSEGDRKHIETFFARIQPWSVAYMCHGRICFLALRESEEWLLVSARVYLETTSRTNPERDFRTSHVWAGSISLKDLGSSPKDLLALLIDGRLNIGDETVTFEPSDQGSYSAFYLPFHTEGLKNNNRLAVLTIAGKRFRLAIDRTELDWELKAAATPFETVDELTGVYQTGMLKGDLQTVEFIAFQTVAVDATSRVEGITARLVASLAAALDPHNVTLGYRVIQSGAVIKRGIIEGRSLQWKKVEDGQRGMKSLRIPKGSILHLIASYSGVAHHQNWFADPKIFPNPRRSAYERFDEGLVILQEFLSKHGKGSARDLESGVAWLLWLLGFSTAHFGANSKTSEGPDLLATTPQGHFLVVECTTGLLKADNKLPKLVDRHTMLVARLQGSGSRHLRALPVIVTSKSKDEIRADVDQAEKLGVLVITSETLSTLVARTVFAQNVDELFSEAEKVIQERQSAHNRAQIPT